LNNFLLLQFTKTKLISSVTKLVRDSNTNFKIFILKYNQSKSITKIAGAKLKFTFMREVYKF